MKRTNYLLRVILEDNHSHSETFVNLPLLDERIAKLKTIQLIKYEDLRKEKKNQFKNPFKVIGEMKFK